MHNQPNRGALTLWAMRQQPAGNREIGKDAVARLLVSLAESSQNGVSEGSNTTHGQYAGSLPVRSVAAGLHLLEEQGFIARHENRTRYVHWTFPNAPAQTLPEYIDPQKTDIQNDLFDWAIQQRPKAAAHSRHLAGRVLTAIAAHADYDGNASVSIEALAEYVGMLPRQASRDHVQTLQDGGLIATVATAAGSAWTFRPIWQKAFHQPPAQA